MNLIDTHTHLFASQFADDRIQVVKNAMELGVSRFMLPNIDVDTIGAMNELHKAFPQHCLPMMGLHPGSVKENYKNALNSIGTELFDSTQTYYGIGETGLDYYWDTSFVKEQKESLIQHVQWAKELDLPIVLHTRNSFDDNISIMEEHQDGRLRGVFHCFTGNLKEANRIIDLGFYMGIGGVITFKNSGEEVRQVIKEIPLEHLVLETDSPYLAPAPHRGKRNESAYIKLVAEKLAEVKDVTVEEIANTTTKNAKKLFKIN